MKSQPFVKFFLIIALCAPLFVPRFAWAAEVKVQVNKPKSLGESTTFIVPTVFVKLPVAGKVFVSKQGGALSIIGGGNANSVKASAHYNVQGMDKAFAQKIAGKVYDDFVARLREAGYTVKTY